MEDNLTSRAKLIFERNNNSPLFLRVADFYLKNNDLQTAISILEDALKNYPNHPLGFILLAKAQHSLGNFAITESYLQEASDLLNSPRTLDYYKRELNLPDKKFSPFDSSRGNVFFDPSDDYVLHDEKTDEKPKSVEDNLSQLAEKLMNTKIERDGNISSIETAQPEYKPDKSKLATETFAEIYISQGETNEAIKIYEQLMHRNPEKKEYYSDKIKKLKSQ